MLNIKSKIKKNSKAFLSYHKSTFFMRKHFFFFRKLSALQGKKFVQRIWWEKKFLQSKRSGKKIVHAENVTFLTPTPPPYHFFYGLPLMDQLLHRPHVV